MSLRVIGVSFWKLIAGNGDQVMAQRPNASGIARGQRCTVGHKEQAVTRAETVPAGLQVAGELHGILPHEEAAAQLDESGRSGWSRTSGAQVFSLPLYL